MVFPAAYCLFSFMCFVSERPAITSLNSKDANGIPLECPQSCLCYQAPRDHFGIDDTSNSMICHDEQVELFYQYFGPNQPKRPVVKLNTMVLKDLKNFKEKTIILNTDSVVLENVPNLKDLTLEGNFRYLTIYAQTDLQSLPEVKSPELRGIYILGFGDKDKTEFLPPTQSFPKLESFTIQHSHFQTILSIRFISAPSLITLDLSHNELVSVDCIIPWDLKDKNYNLKNLYLNDNCLNAIPKGLINSFPKLETVHLHRNRIQTLDHRAIKLLITIPEFILFEPTPGNSLLIGHYGDRLKWVPKTDSFRAIGLLDSLSNVNIMCCDEDESKSFSYKLALNLPYCGACVRHPERAYPDKTQFHRGNGRPESIDLQGLVFDQQREGVNFGRMKGKHNTIWLQFSGFYQTDEKNYFELRNFLHVTQRMSYDVIFRFNDIDKAMAKDKDLEELNNMLTYVLDGRPNFVGFEIEIFDASFAGISIDKNTNPGDCTLKFPTEELKKKFFDRVDIYKKFTAKMHSLQTDIDRYPFFVTIDAKCLDIAKIFLQDGQVKKCFRDDDVWVNGISVVNLDTEDADYQKHEALFSEYDKDSTKVTFKEVHSGQKNPSRIVSMGVGSVSCLPQSRHA